MPPIAVAVPLLPFHHSSLNFNTETALWVDGFALTLTDYVRLQVVLAEAESKFNCAAAGSRLVDAYLNI